MEEKINILYIDDEVNNLNAFRAHFRNVDRYEVFTCQSGEEGLKILYQFPIQVVIADQRMPEMTGVEFIENAIKSLLNPIKIVVTAHRDTSKVQEAFEAGKIFGYHEKPFDTNLRELKQSIEDACREYHKQKNE